MKNELIEKSKVAFKQFERTLIKTGVSDLNDKNIETLSSHYVKDVEDEMNTLLRVLDISEFDNEFASTVQTGKPFKSDISNLVFQTAQMRFLNKELSKPRFQNLNKSEKNSLAINGYCVVKAGVKKFDGELDEYDLNMSMLGYFLTHSESLVTSEDLVKENLLDPTEALEIAEYYLSKKKLFRFGFWN